MKAKVTNIDLVYDDRGVITKAVFTVFSPKAKDINEVAEAFYKQETINIYTRREKKK